MVGKNMVVFFVKLMENDENDMIKDFKTSFSSLKVWMNGLCFLNSFLIEKQYRKVCPFIHDFKIFKQFKQTKEVLNNENN